MSDFEFTPCLPEYAETLFSWRSDPVAVKFNPLEPITFDEYKQGLNKFGHDLRQLVKCEKFRWAVKQDNELVGVVSIHTINIRMQTAEIGYTVSPNHYRQGIGTKVVRQLVDKIFKETELRKISALVHIQNIPSQKLLNRLGFTREGVLRQHFLVNGLPVDEIYFGLLRSEWLLS